MHVAVAAGGAEVGWCQSHRANAAVMHWAPTYGRQMFATTLQYVADCCSAGGMQHHWHPTSYWEDQSCMHAVLSAGASDVGQATAATGAKASRLDDASYLVLVWLDDCSVFPSASLLQS